VRLAGKVAVVTGAGSGIGRATALAFAAEGARVAACDIDADRIGALGRELGPGALLAERVDVSDRAQMAAFAAAVHARAPAADVIVNNAGVACGGDFVDISLDDWDWLLGVNLRGVVHGCHFFVPKLIERGAGGHVINVSSVFGLYAPPKHTPYVASKFAVLGFSRSLRAELAPHRIGVTAICPGMIATSIVDDSRAAGKIAQLKPRIAELFRRKGAHPDTVARAILDAVHRNPAIRPVGRDAWMLWALNRVSPSAVTRLGTAMTRRFTAGE